MTLCVVHGRGAGAAAAAAAAANRVITYTVAWVYAYSEASLEGVKKGRQYDRAWSSQQSIIDQSLWNDRNAPYSETSATYSFLTRNCCNILFHL